MISTRLPFKEHPSFFQIGVFFVVLIFIAGLVWSFVTDRKEIVEESPLFAATTTREDIVLDPHLPYRTPLVVSDTPTLSVTTNEVIIKDQVASDVVFLMKAALTKGGWVAVREGTPESAGSILGAARFDAGVWQGDIPLLRSLEAGKTYHAVLYYDDGDKVFDFKKDIPITKGDSVIGMTFKAY